MQQDVHTCTTVLTLEGVEPLLSQRPRVLDTSVGFGSYTEHMIISCMPVTLYYQVDKEAYTNTYNTYIWNDEYIHAFILTASGNNEQYTLAGIWVIYD